MKFSAEVETMNLTVFTLYVELCAATLARAHARTSDPAQISGYLGNGDTFDRAIASFAELYADQAELTKQPPFPPLKMDGGQAQTADKNRSPSSGRGAPPPLRFEIPT